MILPQRWNENTNHAVEAPLVRILNTDVRCLNGDRRPGCGQENTSTVDSQSDGPGTASVGSVGPSQSSIGG